MIVKPEIFFKKIYKNKLETMKVGDENNKTIYSYTGSWDRLFLNKTWVTRPYQTKEAILSPEREEFRPS